MKIAILITSLLAFFTANGQVNHRMSPQEELEMPAYLLRNDLASVSSITLPPSTPVRAPAEWEEIDALMIAWTSQPAILSQIVELAQQDARVFIVCTDSTAVKSALNLNGVTLSNTEFVVAPFNSIWCRDYGQWNIYRSDVDSLALIDWIYNRPRPKDDSVPYAIESYTGLPMYEMNTSPYNLVHTGGNFMVDGFGTAFSSKLVLNENLSKTEVQIDSIMQLYMGIDRYVKMNTLPYDQIHHIDMHMKLLDEETLLVGEYPPNISDGPQIEANLQYVLANYNSIFGTPYKVIRIPMPPDANGDYPSSGGDYRTYTNSVFVNKTIILPLYAQQYDTTAIRIYREALPGYNVVGINCNSIIPSLGAIHCITKEVAAPEPLLISHQQLSNTYNTIMPYSVSAFIKHHSGIQQAILYFRTDTAQPWQSVAMNALGSDMWSAGIPAQTGGTTVFYYIEAQSVSGKTQYRPMPAPAGHWRFDVLFITGISALETLVAGPVFPNPSHGLTCIPVTTSAAVRLKIRLNNILGEEVLLIFEGTNSGEKKYFMNTESLSAGVYILELNTGFESVTQKIIVR